MIEYLNDNQGAIIVVLTVVLILVNLLYWWISHKQYQLLEKQWNSSLQPIVNITPYKSIDGFLYFLISNSSNVYIPNLKIEIEESFVDIIYPFCENQKSFKGQISLLKNHGFSLQPNQSIDIYTWTKYQSFKKMELKVNIIYLTSTGETITKIVDLDINTVLVEGQNANLKIVEVLREINKQLSNISIRLEK